MPRVNGVIVKNVQLSITDDYSKGIVAFFDARREAGLGRLWKKNWPAEASGL
jgi:hypothetical protein